MALLTSIIYNTGAATLIYVLYQLARFVSIYLQPSKLYRFNHGAQAWACVTGATDGIGLGIAQELATHNFNLILHGRDLRKLENVRSSILETNPAISILLFVFNAKEYASIEASSLPQLVEGLNITILVNNVGMGYEVLEAEDIDRQINTNLRFASHLTNYLLPALKSHHPALVLTMGSITETGMPWLEVYAGTKAYLAGWSKSMSMKMRAEGSDVEFLLLGIGEVATAGNAQEETFTRPAARSWARTALNQVGYDRRYVHGYWVHALQRWAVDSLPGRVRDMIIIPVVSKRKSTWGKAK